MLPRPYRLHLDKDIKALFAKGKGVFDVYVGLKFRKNGLDVSRFAIVIGTKTSKSAVVRNRLRRQVRELIRMRLPEIQPGFDAMLIIRKEAVGRTFEEIGQHVVAGLRKAKML